MKRLVICLDGTWNNASREVEKGDRRVYRPTNVLKIARAVKVMDGDTEQVTYYDAGVGAMNRVPDGGAKLLKRVENTLGGGWGTGFEVNIEEAYTFLSNNYNPGDEIFVFGFSRGGAAQARSLCNLIQWAGGFPPKHDAYYVPTIFGRYLLDQAQDSVQGLLAEINDRKRKKNRPEVTIVPAGVRFLGVWDTVLALGLRIAAGPGTTNHRLSFHTPRQPPAIVDTIRHALAIDELRHDFQPEVFEAGDSLEQRWFVGAHSNIGGGLVEDSLANAALRWMHAEATSAGLAFDNRFLQHYWSNPLRPAQSKAFKYKVIDTVLWPFRSYHGVRRIGGGNATLDDSVFQRLNAEGADLKDIGKPYRPTHLLEFLAANPRFDGELSDKASAAVKRHRATRHD